MEFNYIIFKFYFTIKILFIDEFLRKTWNVEVLFFFFLAENRIMNHFCYHCSLSWKRSTLSKSNLTLSKEKKKINSYWNQWSDSWFWKKKKKKGNPPNDRNLSLNSKKIRRNEWKIFNEMQMQWNRNLYEVILLVLLSEVLIYS